MDVSKPLAPLGVQERAYRTHDVEPAVLDGGVVVVAGSDEVDIVNVGGKQLDGVVHNLIDDVIPRTHGS